MLCLCDQSAHAVYTSGVGFRRFSSAAEEREALASCQVSALLRDQVRSWAPYRDRLPLLAMASDMSLRSILRPPRGVDPGSLLPRFLRACDQPVHFLAQGASGRGRSSGIAARSLGWLPPSGSFLLCEASHEQVLVPAPELHLLLRASRLDLLDLALLVCEYCGTYWNRPDTTRGLADGGAATSRAQILAYLKQVPLRVRGKARLRAATQLAFDHSASPRESGLALLETYRSGATGFGLPRPALNRPVALSAVARPYVGGCPQVSPDQTWPGTRCCAEYESDLDHGGEGDPHALEKRKRDENRRRALEEEGYQVNVVFANDLRDIWSVDRTMRRLARSLGVAADWAPVGEWLEPLRERLLGYRCVI